MTDHTAQPPTSPTISLVEAVSIVTRDWTDYVASGTTATAAVDAVRDLSLADLAEISSYTATQAYELVRNTSWAELGPAIETAEEILADEDECWFCCGHDSLSIFTTIEGAHLTCSECRSYHAALDN